MPASRYLFGALPWYSVLVVGGMLAAILLASREEKRLGLPKDTALDLALTVLPLGVLGARLYYVAFQWPAYAANPLRILRVWEGGLAIYGGILGGMLAVLLFARMRRLSLAVLLDSIAPGVALAQAIGRWGNFFNMEAYGAAVTDPRLQFFPFAVLIPEGGVYVWHQATFFYESLWNLLVFAALWSLRRRGRPGDTFLRYTLLYGAGRLVVEGLRTDSLYLGETLRVSQALAACAVLAVLALLIFRTGKSRGLSAALTGGLAVLVIAAVLGLDASLALTLALLLCGAYALTALRRAQAVEKADIALLICAAAADALGLLPALRQRPTAVCICFSVSAVLLAAALRLFPCSRRADRR